MQHNMTPYVRQIQYYETDKMGIVHHSNYIRWFEEARIRFIGQAEHYLVMEKAGIMMPVTDVTCKYITSAEFGDTVEIHLRLNFFNGIRAVFGYEIYRVSDQALVATGESSHCFWEQTHRIPVNLKKWYPEFYHWGLNALEENAE